MTNRRIWRCKRSGERASEVLRTDGQGIMGMGAQQRWMPYLQWHIIAPEALTSRVDAVAGENVTVDARRCRRRRRTRQQQPCAAGDAEGARRAHAS
jgi:hypothetical protein